jgi:hypothetical protein
LRIEPKLEPALVQPVAELDVLASQERRIEATRREHVLAPDRRVARPKLAERGRPVAPQHGFVLCFELGLLPRDPRLPVVGKRRERTDDDEVFLAPVRAQVLGDEVLAGLDVVVDEEKDRPTRRVHARVPGLGRAGVLLANRVEREAEALLFEPLERTVARPVVDDDHLENIAIRLPAERGQHPLEPREPIVGGNDDADCFRIHQAHADTICH